jgi:hypothetical protein
VGERPRQHFEDPASAPRSTPSCARPSSRTPPSSSRSAELKPAEQLYADLVENPADTYVAIGEELFGEDAPRPSRTS